MISAVLALWTSRQGQAYAIVSCLLGYWVLMRYVAVPGFGIPTHDIPLLDPDRNLAAWLDRKLLFGHLYEITRDPEGILSTIPAIATSLLGIQTGEWLRSARSPKAKVAGMALFGVIGVAAGEILNLWFYQQEAVDELLRCLHRRSCPHLPRDLFLDIRHKKMASRDHADSRFWNEFYRRLRIRRSSRHSALPH